jgi:hypothetical protein
MGMALEGLAIIESADAAATVVNNSLEGLRIVPILLAAPSGHDNETCNNFNQ